jgi:hypothetical protein
MKKYRCLTDDYRGIDGCKKGKVYNANHTWGAKIHTVEDFTKMYPQDWELVEDEFVLPEKWCIKRTKETDEIITNWINKTYNTNYTLRNLNHPWIPNEKLEGNIVSQKYKHEDRTEITFEQFEKYVLMKEEKEIIGYLTPSNLWGSEIPKGSVYIKDKNSPGNYCWQDDLHAGYRIPSEIVETWKPVYKETKTLPEISGYKGEITQLDKVVKYGCAHLSAKGIEEFLANKSIGINRKINSITLCSGVEITIDQLQQIVDYFKD